MSLLRNMHLLEAQHMVCEMYHLSSKKKTLSESEIPNVKDQGIKDHVIISGAPSEWFYCVAPQRSVCLTHFKPIVIVYDHPPTESQWAEIAIFPEVYFLKGSPLNFDDLDRLGVQYSNCVIILADRRDTSEKEEHPLLGFSSFLTCFFLNSGLFRLRLCSKLY